MTAVAALAWHSVSGEAAHAVFGEPVRVPQVAQKGMAVAMEGSRLFAGAGSTLYAFDVSEPLKPELISSLDGFDNLRQIRVRGRFAYVVSRETGMRVVDVSDPAHMRIRALYDSVEFATGIEVAGNVAFVSERTYGVEAVDVSNPDRPMHIALVKTPESQTCRYRDGYLYSGEWAKGVVTVFDARDMRRFSKVREVPLGGFGDGLDIDGKYLYCSTGHDVPRHKNVPKADGEGAGRGLDVFDISDPAEPLHVSRVDFPVFKPRNDDFWTPRVANGMAFCCDSHNGLFAVDVRDPAQPKIVDRLLIPDPKKPEWPSAAISSLEVGDGCLYMTCTPGGLFVVPVKDAKTPERQLGALPANASHREPYTSDESKFYVYRPSLPGQARTVALRGDVAYAAFGDAGLHVLRISETSGFEKLGELPGGRRVTDCCISGDRLVTAEGLDGFAVYKIEGDAVFREIARRKGIGDRGSVAFWCWAPDGSHVVLSSRNGPYAFFDIDRFSDAEPLAALKSGATLWSKYPADVCLNGRYPVAVPSKGLSWMDMGGEKPVVASSPSARMTEHLISQHDGVAALGDRYIATADGGYRLYSCDGTATEWKAFGKNGHSGVPRTDGRNVVVSHRASKLVSVWDFSDAERPVLLRRHRLSGNPDAAALYHGKAVIPAGYQGLLLER